jgi:hypothetical protein
MANSGQLAGLAALGALGLMYDRMNRTQNGSKVPIEDKSIYPAGMGPTPPIDDESQWGTQTAGQREYAASVNPDDESQWGTPVPGQVAYRKPVRRPTTQTARPTAQTSQAPSMGSRYPTQAQRLTTTNDPRVNPNFNPSTQPGYGPSGNLPSTRPPEEPGLEGVHPEMALMPSAGLRGVATLAKMLANRDKGPYFSQQALENNPTRQITGPSKADLVARDRAARASNRQEQMLNENAANYGLDPNAPGYTAAAQALRDQLGGKDFTVKKKGGAIKAKPKAKAKPKKMASGGMTSRGTASKRADGIATKGHTKCKIR